MHRMIGWLMILVGPTAEPPSNSDPPPRQVEAQKRYAAGVLAVKRGLFLDAVKAFEDSLRLDPEALPPRRMLSRHYLTVGRPDDALAMAKQVAEREPADPEAWHLYASQLHDRGRAAEAISAQWRAIAYASASRVQDKLAVWLKELATWARANRDWKSAESALRRFLELLQHNRDEFLRSGFFAEEEWFHEVALAWERLGETLLDLDRPDDAETAFDKARNLFASRSDETARLWQARLHWHQARTLVARRDDRAALLHLREYLQQVTPTNREPYELAARILLRLSPEDAGRQLERWIPESNKDVTLQLLLADTFAQGRQLARAEQIYSQLAQRTPRWDVYLAWFRLLEKTGSYREVLQVFDRHSSVLDEPDPPAAKRQTAERHVRAMSAALLKQPSLILRLLPEADEKRRQQFRNQNLNYSTFSRLAFLIAQTDRLDDAERYFRELLNSRFSRWFTVNYDLALLRILMKQRNYAAVRELCETRLQMLEEIPNGNLNEHLYQGYLEEALEHQGELADALRINELTQVLAQREEDKIAARLRRAHLLHLLGRVEEALKLCDELLKDYPQPSHARQIRQRKAVILSQQRRFAESERIWREMLESDPNDAQVLNSLGYEWADQNRRLEEAESMIRRALELDRRERRIAAGADPDADIEVEENAAYLDSLAWVRFRQGHWDEARAILERAVTLREGRDEPTLWDHLGDVYARSGDPAKAKNAWLRARTLYDREPLAKKDGRLDELNRKLKLFP
jgi:tetratricopeptide (TPR) repeat protein